jgi:mannose-6-phosphate isomerase-like protein (cupin superfamily)
MNYIEQLDLRQDGALKPNGNRAQCLYAGPSCAVIVTEVPAGGHAWARHTHDREQLYYVLEGAMELESGDSSREVEQHAAVLIPAGLPHHNHNPGSVPERHLEVFAPGFRAGEALAQLTESRVADGKEVVVRPAESIRRNEVERAWEWLITPESGGQGAMMGVVTMPSGSSGPPMHIHRFDQFYLVLEGELSVEIALEEFVVPADHLVVLPAGVPHRQWNPTPDVERHVSLNVPPPAAQEAGRWDIPVSFAVAP